MPLKFRYAFFLFLVIALLVIFGAAAVFFLKKGSYLLTVCLFFMLYLITFQLGRKFSKIFLTLSFLRTLKQQHGVISLKEYQDFISKALARRRNDEEKQRLTREVLQIMVDEGVVTVQDSTILLLAD